MEVYADVTPFKKSVAAFTLQQHLQYQGQESLFMGAFE